MNFKTNLLSAAIALSLLTACGGSSSSSSAPAVDLGGETPAEQLQYTFTEAELLGLGKTFVAGIDLQTGQFASSLGKINSGLVKSAGGDGSESIQRGLGLFFDSVTSLDEAIHSLRSVVEHGFAPAPALAPLPQSEKSLSARSFVLDQDFQIGGLTYRFSMNDADQIVLSGSTTRSAEDSQVISDVTLTYVEVSDSAHQLLISSTLTESSTGIL